MQKIWDSGIDYAELSDVGMRRSNNQDSFVSVLAKSEKRFITHGHLFIVADGMGAHAAGELASQLAVDEISRAFFQFETMDRDAIEAAFHHANREIYNKGQSNPEFHNMGTTASSLVLNQAGATIAHVGDSRVYRLRNDCLEQLTFDHSLVWEIEANPELKTSSWSGPIPKNVITRSLGPNAAVQVDIEGPFAVQPGDRFVLCSDGLSGVVEDEEIGTLAGCLDPERATQVLADLANLRGGPDNITVTIVHVAEDSPDPDSAPLSQPSSNSKKTPGWLLYSIVFQWLATALFGALLLGGKDQFSIFTIVTFTTALISSVAAWGWLATKNQSSHTKLNLPQGKAPYRSYDARPSNDLYERLGRTIQALRDASAENNWLMEWHSVEHYQQLGQMEINQDRARDAVRYQSCAILEAMKQLREQQNRAANDTSVDL